MGKGNDKRGLRAWVKVQLQDTAAAYEAADLVNEWRGTRQAAYHLTRAIRLYGALLRGDTSLLLEMFPLLTSAPRSASVSAEDAVLRPAAPRIAGASTPKKRLVQKSADEDEDDFFSSLGLG